MTTNTQQNRPMKIKEAVLKFFPSYLKEIEKLKETHQNLKKQKYPDALREFIQIQAVASFQSEQIVLLNKYKEKIISRLIEGSLYLYGYAIPRTPKDSPVQVMPNEIKEGKINWQENILISNREIHHLRILESPLGKNKTLTTAIKIKEAIQPTQLKNPETTKGKKAGRPSHAEKVFAIYTKLNNEGYVDFSQTNRAIYDQIRHEAHKAFPDIFTFDPSRSKYRHLSDTMLKNLLAEDIKSKKTSKKS